MKFYNFRSPFFITRLHPKHTLLNIFFCASITHIRGQRSSHAHPYRVQTSQAHCGLPPTSVAAQVSAPASQCDLLLFLTFGLRGFSLPRTPIYVTRHLQEYKVAYHEPRNLLALTHTVFPCQARSCTIIVIRRQTSLTLLSTTLLESPLGPFTDIA